MTDVSTPPQADARLAGLDSWLDQVVALLEKSGRKAQATVIQNQRGRKPKTEPMVVVAGEDKRGKSSLVNALLGRAGLSPIGVEVTTGAPITFRRTQNDSASVLRYDESQWQSVPFEEAQRLATVQGNPGNAENIRSVLLGIDVELLDAVRVVDTPGVGGLESGHATLTLQKLKEADALLFVIEAGAQLRGEELRFLENASERIHRVIFALTKVDLYRGWAQIMADNRRILAEQAPRFADCPMIPVSSTLALRALRLDEPARSELRQEAGISELERVLVEQVGGHLAGLTLANLTETALAPLSVFERQLTERVEALGSSEETRDALAAERTRLAELGNERAEWPMVLSTEMRRLGLDRAEEVSRGMIEVKARYEERLKKVKHEEQSTLAGEFVADLTAITLKVNDWTEDRLVELLTKLVHDIDSAARISDTMRQMTDAGLIAELASTGLGDYSLSAGDKITVAQAYMSGHSVASLVAAGGLAAVGLGVLALPIGILAGGAMMFTRFRVSKQTSFTHEFSSWMQEQTQRTQISLTNSFMRTQIDLESGIRDVLKKAFADREAEITAAIATCQEADRLEQSTRQAQRQQAETTLTRVRELKAAGLEYLKGAEV